MAKRISQSAVNWAAMAERVPAEQRSYFLSFKTRSDAYLRKVLANPESPPKIDWALYKDKVPISGMVANFQKQYEALKVPYPEDKLSSQVEAQWQEVKKEIEKFVQASNERIVKYEKDIEHTKSLLPYSEMTMEDFRDAHPDLAIDPLNKPTFWPHLPEDQVGYEEKPQAASH